MTDPVTVFEYQVIDDNGALVIRVAGAMISGALGQLKEQAAASQVSVSTLMSPLSFVKGLLSPAAAVGGQFQQAPESTSPSVPVAPPDWLSQELAQTFEDFQKQVQEFRAVLEEIKGGANVDDAPPGGGQDEIRK